MALCVGLTNLSAGGMMAVVKLSSIRLLVIYFSHIAWLNSNKGE
jgi:hypothetical protein